MSYKAIIFDLDGTVLNTAQGLAVAVNKARVAMGLNEQPVEELAGMVGNGARKLIARSIARDKGEGVAAEDVIDSDEVAELLAIDRKIYLECCIAYTTPYDGVIARLRHRHDADIKIAVLSNKDHDATFKLCDFFFHDMLDDIRGHREGVALKPDPEPVMLTLEKLGVKASDAVLVGDSEVDIRLARNCNMDIISVDWGFKTQDFLFTNGASVVVSTVEELEAKLLG